MNSTGLISAQWPSSEGESARARPRWRSCGKVPRVLGNWKIVPVLFLCAADRSQKSPSPSISSPRMPLTTARTQIVPDAVRTGHGRR
jgi:hypothetical protein